MKNKIFTPNQAARIVLSLLTQGVNEVELGEMYHNLQVKQHKTKGPSKLGKVYRIKYNRCRGMEHSHTKEMARRVRQIEAGIIKVG